MNKILPKRTSRIKPAAYAVMGRSAPSILSTNPWRLPLQSLETLHDDPISNIIEEVTGPDPERNAALNTTPESIVMETSQENTIFNKKQDDFLKNTIAILHEANNTTPSQGENKIFFKYLKGAIQYIEVLHATVKVLSARKMSDILTKENVAVFCYSQSNLKYFKKIIDFLFGNNEALKLFTDDNLQELIDVIDESSNILKGIRLLFAHGILSQRTLNHLISSKSYALDVANSFVMLYKESPELLDANICEVIAGSEDLAKNKTSFFVGLYRKNRQLAFNEAILIAVNGGNLKNIEALVEAVFLLDQEDKSFITEMRVLLLILSEHVSELTDAIILLSRQDKALLKMDILMNLFFSGANAKSLADGIISLYVYDEHLLSEEVLNQLNILSCPDKVVQNFIALDKSCKGIFQKEDLLCILMTGEEESENILEKLALLHQRNEHLLDEEVIKKLLSSPYSLKRRIHLLWKLSDFPELFQNNANCYTVIFSENMPKICFALITLHQTDPKLINSNTRKQLFESGADALEWTKNCIKQYKEHSLMPLSLEEIPAHLQKHEAQLIKIKCLYPYFSESINNHFKTILKALAILDTTNERIKNDEIIIHLVIGGEDKAEQRANVVVTLYEKNEEFVTSNNLSTVFNHSHPESMAKAFVMVAKIDLNNRRLEMRMSDYQILCVAGLAAERIASILVEINKVYVIQESMAEKIIALASLEASLSSLLLLSRIPELLKEKDNCLAAIMDTVKPSFITLALIKLYKKDPTLITSNLRQALVDAGVKAVTVADDYIKRYENNIERQALEEPGTSMLKRERKFRV